VLLGEESNIPWDVRLFPLVVIITIFLSGMMVPATSLVEEKVKRTYRALLTTPASLVDILTAKGLTGVILALFSGVFILYPNSDKPKPKRIQPQRQQRNTKENPKNLRDPL
jgi:ABC-2 type transport system permease protein